MPKMYQCIMSDKCGATGCPHAEPHEWMENRGCAQSKCYKLIGAQMGKDPSDLTEMEIHKYAGPNAGCVEVGGE